MPTHRKLFAIGGSVIAKVGGAAAAFAWQLFFYSLLGATSGGFLAILLAKIRVIGTIGSFGLDRRLAIDLPQLLQKGGYTSAWAYTTSSLVVGCGIATVLSICFSVFQVFASPGTFMAGGIAVAILILGAAGFSGLIIVVGAIRGNGHAIEADLFFSAVPSVVAVLLTGVVMIATPDRVTVSAVASCFLASQIICVMACYIRLRRKGRSHKPRVVRAVAAGFRLMKGSRALALASLVPVLLPDLMLLLLGALGGVLPAAAFGIAIRYIRIARFVPTSITHVLEPRLAALKKAGQNLEVEHVARRSAIGSFAVSAVVLGILYLNREMLLRIFGSEFVSYTSMFAILLVAELVYANTVPVISVLLINAQAKALAQMHIFSAASAALITCVLTPFSHSVAVAGAVGMLTCNLWVFAGARRRLIRMGKASPDVLSQLRRAMIR